MNPLYIAQKLYERYEHEEEVKHYYGVLAIYGLVQTAEEKEDAYLLEKCKRILSRFPDHIEHPHYNFPSYRIGGIAKSYAYMRNLAPEAEQEVREYAEEMMTAARDRRGIVCMPRQSEEEKIWIDAATAVTPYLLYAGLAFHELRYMDEAVKQTLLMIDEFRNPQNGLLHQCKNFIAPGVYSQDHWGRGNGWGYFPLAELVRWLPADSAHRPAVEKAFTDLSASLLPHQSKRGLWRQEIPFPYSYEETSGTGLILYGFGVGMRLGLLNRDEYGPAFRRGVEGLNKLSISPDFSTEHGCPGCLCPGDGDEKGTVKAYVTLKLPRRNEHHSFAPLILAMVEAYRNGVVDLPR